MAMSHVDFTMQVLLLACPVAAAVGAYQAGAGWLTVLFVPIGLTIGVAGTWIGRRLVYAYTWIVIRGCERITPEWVQGIIGAPFLIIYIALPVLIIYASP